MITLTTDFGTRDGYVAAMKGVILGICPEAHIVDVSHDISPQNVAQGAFVLDNAVQYFPSDAVHVAVVDPGVGTSRQPIALSTSAGFFIGPDNGIFTHVLRRLGHMTGAEVPEGCSAVVLDKTEYWRHPVSNTFHGRDIFAPVAAHLAKGVPMEKLGSPIDSLVSLKLSQPFVRGNHVEGRILHVDSFGNLISDIPASLIDRDVVSVRIADRTNSGLNETYGVGEGLMALVGSHGYLEIAWRNGSATQRLDADVGETVVVELKREA
ncbi:MAG: SAM-dependent chlorinase/fluorinase [Chloroflexi bacterium]|nr:SAM-dependent chlorinase/fluorinase [Chloroflexota bacterium]